MKKILIVTASRSSRSVAISNRQAFIDSLKNQINTTTVVDMTSLTNLIFNISNCKHYLLEVNRAPQIHTGAFVDNKIAAYAAMIDDRIKTV